MLNKTILPHGGNASRGEVRNVELANSCFSGVEASVLALLVGGVEGVMGPGLVEEGADDVAGDFRFDGVDGVGCLRASEVAGADAATTEHNNPAK